jgi:hypothetical protein
MSEKQRSAPWRDRFNLKYAPVVREFSAAEWPFEMELINSGGTLNVIVTEGRIRTQNLDASAVTTRCARATIKNRPTLLREPVTFTMYGNDVFGVVRIRLNFLAQPPNVDIHGSGPQKWCPLPYGFQQYDEREYATFSLH